MAKDYASDFARGYEYARQRYGELAVSFGRATLVELAGALARTEGGNAELARGMAAGLAEAARAERKGQAHVCGPAGEG
jgi:hypothetical protein